MPRLARFQLFIAAAAASLFLNGGIQEKGRSAIFKDKLVFGACVCLVSCTREAKIKHLTSNTHTHTRSHVCVCVLRKEKRGRQVLGIQFHRSFNSERESSRLERKAAPPAGIDPTDC